MNLYLLGLTLWRARLAVVLCSVLAAAVGIVVAFHVSFSPPSLRPKSLQLGVAGAQLLVDTQRSTVGAVHPPASSLAKLAGTYSELMSAPAVIDPVARSLGVAPRRIGIQEQLTQQLQVAQSQPKEPQVGVEIAATQQNYYLLARNDSGSQVIQLFTQAPTGAQALRMVKAAVMGLRAYLRGSQDHGHISLRRRVVLRTLGPAFGQTIDRAASTEAAVLIGLFTWVFSITAVLTLRSQARRVRAGEPPLTASFGA